MVNADLWLDLLLSPHTLKSAVSQWLAVNPDSDPSAFIAQQLERNHQIDAHTKQAGLVAWLGQSNQGFIPYPELPEQLRAINDPPLGLFYQGNRALLNNTQFAIVGSRKPTPAGTENTIQFAHQLTQAGLTLVSGLASGIDSLVHTTCLKAQGHTIAVLGQGLEHCYPKHNHALQQSIKEQGLLLSEYLPDCKVKAWQFPKRNRIISALSEGVLLTEAALKSGSLITAKLAAEQGRQVFALPGDILNPMVAGCHHLIREGAQLVTHAEEILEAIFWNQQHKLSLIPREAQKHPLTKEENKVFKILDRTPTSIDKIQARTECELTLVLDALFSLELRGLIISSIDGYYKPTQGDTC